MVFPPIVLRKGGLNGGKVHFKFNWKKHFGENEVLDTTNLLHLVRKISAKLGVFHVSGKKKSLHCRSVFCFSSPTFFRKKIGWLSPTHPTKNMQS